MPGLLRGVARTAAVAGTATAVSNRVHTGRNGSRRRAGSGAGPMSSIPRARASSRGSGISQGAPQLLAQLLPARPEPLLRSRHGDPESARDGARGIALVVIEEVRLARPLRQLRDLAPEVLPQILLLDLLGGRWSDRERQCAERKAAGVERAAAGRAPDLLQGRMTDDLEEPAAEARMGRGGPASPETPGGRLPGRRHRRPSTRARTLAQWRAPFW